MNSSLKLLGAAAVLAVSSTTAHAQLIISEIVDGNLPGGQPKMVEITNTSGAPVDLSLYRISHYNNGAAVPTSSLPVTPGFLAPGASWTINYLGSSTSGAFLATYGFSPDQETTNTGHNGNDAIALELIATPTPPVDVFGFITCNPIGSAGLNCGSGGTPPPLSPCGSAPNTPWDYEDGYAYRCGVTANGGVWDASDWVLPGSDTLQDCANPGPGDTARLQALTTPGVKQGCISVPTTYCTAKINSQGCSPAIGFIGSPSATATSGFTLRATQELNNKVGLVLYSEFGRDASTFGPGGLLCVKAPTRRSKGFNSGGSVPPAADCTGIFQIDFNTFGRGLLGTPPNPAAYLSVPGQVVTTQFWGRDPGIPPPNNFSLSNGLEYTVGP